MPLVNESGGGSAVQPAPSSPPSEMSLSIIQADRLDGCLTLQSSNNSLSKPQLLSGSGSQCFIFINNTPVNRGDCGQVAHPSCSVSFEKSPARGLLIREDSGLFQVGRLTL
jgi:hypothetical protein